MKANAITRIVIFSVVIIMLLAILAVGLGMGAFSFNFDFDTGEYITGDGSVPASAVHNLEIEWASGEITIEAQETDSINFTETGNVPEGSEMVYELNGDTLTIRYSKPRLQIGFFSTPSKQLTITVPNNWRCDNLNIDTAATDITAYNLNAYAVDLDSASGTCHFNECNITELDADTASGNIYYNGKLQKLDCDAASADITGIFSEAPQQINVDSASGQLDITLPPECGFTVNMDTLSGKFNSDFATNTVNNKYVYGDGSCQINVDSASGNVTIRKGS